MYCKAYCPPEGPIPTHRLNLKLYRLNLKLYRLNLKLYWICRIIGNYYGSTGIPNVSTLFGTSFVLVLMFVNLVGYGS